MKKIFILMSLFAFLGTAASAQNPLTLTTAPLGGAKAIVLPTFDNMIKLIKANDIQFKAAMKRYGYARPDGETTGGYLNIVYWITKDRDPGTKCLYVWMDLGAIRDEMAGYLDTLEADLKKRFPDAVVTVDGTTTSIAFVLKTASGKHHYKIALDRTPPTEQQGGATITMID